MDILPKRDSDRLEPIIDDSISALKALLQADEPSEDQIVKAHMAKSVVATWAKLKATESSRDTLFYAMAKDMASNPDELRKYIAATTPGGSHVKKLLAGDEEKK